MLETTFRIYRAGIRSLSLLHLSWFSVLFSMMLDTAGSRAQPASFRKLDDEKMKAIVDIVDNFRPTKPLNGRTVSLWN